MRDDPTPLPQWGILRSLLLLKYLERVLEGLCFDLDLSFRQRYHPFQFIIFAVATALACVGGTWVKFQHSCDTAAGVPEVIARADSSASVFIIASKGGGACGTRLRRFFETACIGIQNSGLLRF